MWSPFSSLIGRPASAAHATGENDGSGDAGERPSASTVAATALIRRWRTIVEAPWREKVIGENRQFFSRYKRFRSLPAAVYVWAAAALKILVKEIASQLFRDTPMASCRLSVPP